jgi:hypothetical protein
MGYKITGNATSTPGAFMSKGKQYIAVSVGEVPKKTLQAA